MASDSAITSVRPSDVITVPFGKCMSAAASADRSVGARPGRDGRSGGRRTRRPAPLVEGAVEVEPEVADVGAARGVDDHVVAVEIRDAAQLGMDADIAAGRTAQQPPLGHRHDQQRTVRHPAKPGRPIVDFEFRPYISGERHRFHRVSKKVAEPQAPLTPPRRLAEIDAVSRKRASPAPYVPPSGKQHMAVLQAASAKRFRCGSHLSRRPKAGRSGKMRADQRNFPRPTGVRVRPVSLRVFGASIECRFSTRLQEVLNEQGLVYPLGAACLIALAGALTPAESAPAPNASSGLDYEYFKTKVQPVFLTKRAGHTRCVVCHTHNNAPFHLVTLSRREHDLERTAVAPELPADPAGGDPRQHGEPDRHHPLAEQAGGDPHHGGGQQFESQKDPAWQTLKAFIMGAEVVSRSTAFP